MPKLERRGGCVRFQRFGQINSKTQKKKNGNAVVAPANRGVWAFPYPYFDWFFASHCWDKYLPKHLRRASIRAADEAGEDVTHLWEEADAWMRRNQHKFKIREFWYGGDVYSRFNANGKVTSEGAFGSFSDDIWNLMPVTLWYELASKSIRSGYSTDHLEVFISGKT